MAEPARQSDPIYDSDDDQPLTARQRAERQWGMAGSTEPSAEDGDTPEDDGGVASGDEGLSAEQRAHKAWGMTPDELANAEESADTDTPDDGTDEAQGTLFHPDEGKAKGQATSKRKKKKGLLIGGGIGAVIVSLIVGFISLLPLKLVHIVENVQKHFFAAGSDATEKYADNIVSAYVKKKIIPGIKGQCSPYKANAQCAAFAGENTTITKLYRAWSDSNFEQKLATNYGLVFETRGSGSSKKIYMTMPGLSLFNQDQPGFDVTGFDSSKTNLFDFIEKDPNNQRSNVSRAELRQRVRNAFEGETKFKQVLYRFKVGRFLERKYGVKRCLVACKSRDGWADWKDKRFMAFKANLVQRVIEPHSEFAGIILGCLTNPSDDCTPSKHVDTDGKGDGPAERKIYQGLDKLFAKLGITTTADALKAAEAIGDKGFEKYLIEKVFTKLGVEEAEQAAQSSVSAFNWANAVIKIIKTLKTAGPTIKRLEYVTATAAMVNVWMMHRTHVDELKTGQVTADFVGGFTDQLDGVQTDKDGKKIAPPGGVQPAENSPLYASLFGDKSSQTALLNVFSPAAYAEAQDKQTPNYTCDDGQNLPKGLLICPEESVVADNYLTQLSDFLNSGPLGTALNGIIAVWDATGNIISEAISKAGDAAVNLPGIKDLIAKITEPLAEFFGPIMTNFTRYLIPSPISTSMSGARDFNMMAGGADAAGADYAHYSLGGKQLTPQQTADILNEQADNDRAQLAIMPLSQRLFDKSSSNSLISRVAIALPSNLTAGIHSLANMFISNPFSKMVGGLGVMLPGMSRAQAQVAAQADPFGIAQFGYPTDDPLFDADPTTFNDQNCSQQNTDWLNSASDPGDGPFGGQFINTTTNPCLLHAAVIEGLGATTDTSFISPGDR